MFFINRKQWFREDQFQKYLKQWEHKTISIISKNALTRSKNSSELLSEANFMEKKQIRGTADCNPKDNGRNARQIKDILRNMRRSERDTKG